MVRLAAAYFMAAGMSMPVSLAMAPYASLIATTFTPSRRAESAKYEATLPKPWMATRWPSSFSPRASAAASSVNVTPRPVASRRPSEPPSETGFPVTQPGTVWPACMEYVSMIQAMVWAFVLTSGAGMSLSGPMMRLISVV